MSNSPYNCLTSSFILLLQYPATHIGPNIFLSTFLSQIRKFFSSFAVKHHASEPYSTTDDNHCHHIAMQDRPTFMLCVTQKSGVWKREHVCGGGCTSTRDRTVFFWTKRIHSRYFCNVSWKTCHQKNWYDVSKISMQSFLRSFIQPWSQEYGVLCTCKIISPTILEETVNSHHYLWIIVAPFFKEFKEGKM